MALQAELFYFAGTMALHRFSISSPDLRIDAAKRSNPGQSVHRFSNSAQDLRIDAAKKLNLGQTVQRFLISGPDLRIDASAWLIPGDIPPAQGLKHYPAAGECRMDRDFGRRSRPWLRER